MMVIVRQQSEKLSLMKSMLSIFDGIAALAAITVLLRVVRSRITKEVSVAAPQAKKA